LYVIFIVQKFGAPYKEPAKIVIKNAPFDEASMTLNEMEEGNLIEPQKKKSMPL
jgi:hypothetical protein